MKYSKTFRRFIFHCKAFVVIVITILVLARTLAICNYFVSFERQIFVSKKKSPTHRASHFLGRWFLLVDAMLTHEQPTDQTATKMSGANEASWSLRGRFGAYKHTYVRLWHLHTR